MQTEEYIYHIIFTGLLSMIFLALFNFILYNNPTNLISYHLAFLLGANLRMIMFLTSIMTNNNKVNKGEK